MCTHCKEATPVKSSAVTRSDLEKEKGENFIVQCKHCHKNNMKHVNDINAKNDPKIILGGLAISFFFTAILWQFFGAISTFTFFIATTILWQQRNSVRAFNAYRIVRS